MILNIMKIMLLMKGVTVNETINGRNKVLDVDPE